jgi:uncharacterized protein
LRVARRKIGLEGDEMAITDEAELRSIYGEMHPRAAKKVIDRLDAHCRAFIAASPFMLVATTDGGRLDVSPKGDPAGSVIVEDDRHLLIADRPGNNRIDGLLNILKHPRVGTIFLIPGVRETLRVNGTATIHADPELLERCGMNGRLPITVLRIEVEEVFLHCATALLRSRLWEPDSWPEGRPVPTMSDMIGDHIKEELAHESDEAMVARYAAMLY